MTSSQTFRIASLPGDGIGPEVVAATREVLDALEQRVPQVKLVFEHHDAGAAHFQRSGVSLSDETLRACEQADAIFLGAMGLPDIRSEDGVEISPQLDIRDAFELFAGVRPIRSMPGVPPVLANPAASQIDFVLVREQTEGLFHARGSKDIRDGIAYDTMAISRSGTERLARFAGDLAQRRSPRPGASKPTITLVDKANVLGSMAYFREVFLAEVAHFDSVAIECAYVDAMALNLVRKPWTYDVLVTENQFGDILSDLCAALIGGMGLAPSADIGLKHAMFQPAHGSAPDIAGKGLANPVATFLSAAMMLDWLGKTHDCAEATQAGELLESATRGAFAAGAVQPAEFGGKHGTRAISEAVVNSLRAL